jgi:SAM-dependent methyltransferase
MKYNSERVWWINTPEGRPDNNGYSAPFPLWWTKYDLQGWGYLIGEQHPQGEWIDRKLKKEYPKIKHAHSVDIRQADIVMDVSIKPLPGNVDFIFCMAVLEHVYDPLMVVRHMGQALNRGGLLCISVPGNGFKQHRRPIDCYRFLEDSLAAFGIIGKVHLLDYAQEREWCAIYRKT